MNIKSRLEIYSSTDIKSRTVILGEKSSLRELGLALIRAADNAAGFESIILYKANGHDYEIFITKNVEESEWQDMPATPDKIVFISQYDELKNKLTKK